MKYSLNRKDVKPTERELDQLNLPKKSKEEIIDILKRNVALYKNERDFATYFVDLAVYLFEYHYLDVPPEARTKQATGTKVRKKGKLGSKIYRVFKTYKGDTEKYCNLCGAPTGGMSRCPNCGNSSML